MQDGRKAVWSIPYVSVAFFPSLKQNFIAYCSSKVADCIFDIHQLWQSDFSRVYSNCCCSCSFEPEIIRISQSSQKIYSNSILNFQESTTILNARTKKSLETYRMHLVYMSARIYIYILIWLCMYRCMYVSMYVCTYVCMYRCMYVCIWLASELRLIIPHSLVISLSLSLCVSPIISLTLSLSLSLTLPLSLSLHEIHSHCISHMCVW